MPGIPESPWTPDIPVTPETPMTPNSEIGPFWTPGMRSDPATHGASPTPSEPAGPCKYDTLHALGISVTPETQTTACSKSETPSTPGIPSEPLQAPLAVLVELQRLLHLALLTCLLRFAFRVN